MPTTNSRVQVLVGYCAGVVLSVPPVSSRWPALGTMAERLVGWVWSSLMQAVDRIPVDLTHTDAVVPPIHHAALVTFLVAALMPALLCAGARTVIQEGAWLKSLGQSVAFVAVPASLLSFLFLPASMAALLLAASVLLSAIIVIEPSSKAGAVMWMVQGVVVIQVVRMVIAGPSSQMVSGFVDRTGFDGDMTLGATTLSLGFQLWLILAAAGVLAVWQSVRAAYGVMKPPPRKTPGGPMLGMEPFGSYGR